MNITDIIILIVRWIHGIAAASWVGGSIFYLLVLRPRLRTSLDADVNQMRDIRREFRGVITTSISILIITGALLSFNRVTSGVIDTTYVIVLTIKVSLAFYMFYVVRFIRSRTNPNRPISTTTKQKERYISSAMTSMTAITIIGIVLFLLADVLSFLFEKGLVR